MRGVSFDISEVQKTAPHLALASPDKLCAPQHTAAAAAAAGVVAAVAHPEAAAAAAAAAVAEAAAAAAEDDAGALRGLVSSIEV